MPHPARRWATKCGMAVNPNFAKKYDPEGGDFLKQIPSQFGFASGGHTFAGGGAEW